MTMPKWFEFKVTLGNLIMFGALLFAFWEGYIRNDERVKSFIEVTQTQYKNIDARLTRIEQLHMKP